MSDPLATTDDIDDLFGAENVAKWASMSSSETAGVVAARKARSLAAAHARVESRLRAMRVYSLPLNGDTTLVVEIEATLAGVWLYERRGVEDVDGNGKPVHRLAWHRDNAERLLEGIVNRTLVLSCEPYAGSLGTNAPATGRQLRR